MVSIPMNRMLVCFLLLFLMTIMNHIYFSVTKIFKKNKRLRESNLSSCCKSNKCKHIAVKEVKADSDGVSIRALVSRSHKYVVLGYVKLGACPNQALRQHILSGLTNNVCLHCIYCNCSYPGQPCREGKIHVP